MTNEKELTPEIVANPVADADPSAFLNRLEKEMDRRIDQMAHAKTLSRKGAVQRLFGDAGETDQANRDRSLGDWLVSVRRGDEANLERKYGSTKASMQTGVGAQGGFLVPEEFLPRLYALSAERALARPRSTVLPMGSRSMQIPVLDTSSTPAAGDSAFFAGMVARWTEEGGPIPQSEPTFRQIELVAHELSGYSKVSNTLLEDSPDGIEALLASLFGAAIAWHEDYAFLRGDGVGKPLGAISPANSAAISINRSSPGNFSLADAAKMITRFLPGYSIERAAWIIHPSVLEKLITMVDLAGNNVFITQMSDKPRLTLFGLPILSTEKVPVAGNPRDVSLINFEHYLIGDRRQVEIAFSEHIAFTTNQSAWRFTVRVDGQPWMRSTQPLADGGTTVSPYLFLN